MDHGEKKHILQHFDRNSVQSARKSMQRVLQDGVHVNVARAKVLDSLRYGAECALQDECRQRAGTAGPWAAAAGSVPELMPVLLLNFDAAQVRVCCLS